MATETIEEVLQHVIVIIYNARRIHDSHARDTYACFVSSSSGLTLP